MNLGSIAMIGQKVCHWRLADYALGIQDWQDQEVEIEKGADRMQIRDVQSV